MKNKVGVIHGRFQGLHNGHIEYLLEGLSRSEFLYIGISNPDPMLSRIDSADIKRSKEISNPFTYYDRLNMIQGSLIDEGISRQKFAIVPFPISYPELIKYYVPNDAMFYVTIYDEWGEKKLATLKNMNLKTDVMWRRSMSERFTSGTEVRERISKSQEWSNLVPDFVYDYINKNELNNRIINLTKDDH